MLYPYTGELKSIYDVNKLLSSYSQLISYEDRKKEVVMDLSNLTFVSPIGAVSLLLLIDRIIEVSNLKVHPPALNENIISYMERMDFFKHCHSTVKNQFKEKYDLDTLANRNRNNKRKVLLEINPIKDENDIDNIFDSSLSILRSHGMQNRNANKIANIVSELATNIVDHSEGIGYGAIQYYPIHNKVLIAIADNGIGIINSLRNHVQQMEDLSDIQVMESAFAKGVSSKNTIMDERGLGLNDVREKAYLDTKGTSFLLRTHEGIYEITDDGIMCHREELYFPGTYIQLGIEF